MPTIVPITSEVAWHPTLERALEWDVPMVPTLVLAPHPDDETLGAGGLIARLRGNDVPVTVIAVTDGEGAYVDTADLASIRVPEQVEALRRLGVSELKIHRLHLPDREVASHEDEVVNLLMPLVREGTHLVAPWPKDFHPDHEATGRAAQRVAQAMGLSLSFYLFWTWHRGTPALLSSVDLARFTLTEQESAAKLYALEAHASQLAHPAGEPILSDDLLAPVRRDFEVYIR